MTLLNPNQSMEIPEGSEFVVHPAGYECDALITEVEEVYDNGELIAYRMHLNCEGAVIKDRISLKLTERYTDKIARWKLSDPMKSCKLIKSSGNFTISDITKCAGRTARVRLGVREYQSNTTGKMLEINEIDRYLMPDSTPKPTAQPQGAPSYDF